MRQGMDGADASRRGTPFLAALLLLGMMPACGRRTSNRNGAVIDECETLLAAQQQCLSATGANAEPSVEATRQSLYAELSQHPDSRDALAARCVEETARLKASCP